MTLKDTDEFMCHVYIASDNVNMLLKATSIPIDDQIIIESTCKRILCVNVVFSFSFRFLSQCAFDAATQSSSLNVFCIQALRIEM